MKIVLATHNEDKYTEISAILSSFPIEIISLKHYPEIEKECIVRGVSYQIIADAQSTEILRSISSPSVNQDVVRLEKTPKIAIYSPKNKQPWDDAVTMALTYAEIPYDIIYYEEVLSGLLPLYDWLHLHHEDFTGQY